MSDYKMDVAMTEADALASLQQLGDYDKLQLQALLERKMNVIAAHYPKNLRERWPKAEDILNKAVEHPFPFRSDDQFVYAATLAGIFELCGNVSKNIADGKEFQYWTEDELMSFFCSSRAEEYSFSAAWLSTRCRVQECIKAVVYNNATKLDKLYIWAVAEADTDFIKDPVKHHRTFYREAFVKEFSKSYRLYKVYTHTSYKKIKGEVNFIQEKVNKKMIANKGKKNITRDLLGCYQEILMFGERATKEVRDEEDDQLDQWVVQHLQDQKAKSLNKSPKKRTGTKARRGKKNDEFAPEKLVLSAGVSKSPTKKSPTKTTFHNKVAKKEEDEDEVRTIRIDMTPLRPLLETNALLKGLCTAAEGVKFYESMLVMDLKDYNIPDDEALSKAVGGIDFAKTTMTQINEDTFDSMLQQLDIESESVESTSIKGALKPGGIHFMLFED